MRSPVLACLACVGMLPAADDAFGASFPGARPAVPEGSGRFAAPAAISLAASSFAGVPPPKLESDAARSAARECPMLRLPWGPIESCTTAVAVSGVAASALVSAAAWWGQGFDSRFSVASEGWFGADTYAGGIDKLGHAFSFYAATRLGTHALVGVGASRDEAVRLSAGVALGFGLGVEGLDGLSRSGRYGFSWEDLAMNAVGVGLGVAMETHPGLDRRFAFRWMYSPRGRDDNWYDHHTYVVALRLSGVEAIGPRNPLRYLEVVVGYGATGFRSDFDFGNGDFRRRTLYAGVALNVTELLDRTVFRGELRDGRAHRWTTEALRYVQPPGTALAFRKNWRP